ncbi:hypothetical protein CSC70_11270 [Pseudoxanthomonas kalamensis DSM 18571]|uniref:hypothetical protein n=1 Tax=Pseudoxanthomonas kalamensis TaxID=289483 RepID=UPI001391C603|nr:hypothetical protein [Pseudoxanthomonas kalamensis]KAF1709378.1 hypothetical protein CSC70_11270 [Pseudoxanthomonas kalamensis DSM 18571]
MNREDIDRLLASEDTITPSPGFVASVMDAVERESATRPSLAFPWARAWPGLLALVVALAAVCQQGLGLLRDPAAVDALDGQLQYIAGIAADYGLPWLVLALAVTAATLFLPSRLVSGGRYA